MPINISLTKEIKADQEFVFDWWTDFSPDDAKLVKPLKSRKVISKSPETIVLEDEEQMYFRRMKYRISVALERPTMWVAEYDGRVARARSEYHLLRSKEENDSEIAITTLNYRTHIEPKGHFTRLFSPIIRPFIKRIFASEMATFIAAIEEEYERARRLPPS